jgi:hypothetical protein
MTELSTDEQAIVDRFGIFEPEQREAAIVERAVLAAMEAAEEMPADSYCPKSARRQRNGCPGCIAEVAATAAVAAYRSTQGGGAEEDRDRELIARHLRSAASALNITDWPAYLLRVADGHADGTSWYRP